MTFLERVEALLSIKGITRNKLLTDIGLNKNAFVVWRERGTFPSSEVIKKIAEYFNVSTDYLLGITDNPTPPLIIHDDLKNIRVAFNRGELEDLTQEEVDKLKEFAKFLKSQRKGE